MIERGRGTRPTHTKPSENTTMRAIFCPKGMCDWKIGYIGRPRMMKSVTIEKTVFASQASTRLMHVPGADLSQAKAIGEHCQIEAAIEATR